MILPRCSDKMPSNISEETKKIPNKHMMKIGKWVFFYLINSINCIFSAFCTTFAQLKNNPF